MKRACQSFVQKTVAGCIILVLASGIFSVIKAQEAETLFSEDVDHGGFGGLVFGATSVNGEFSYLRGTRGAWVINFSNKHSIHLGLARYSTHSDFAPYNWPLTNSEAPGMNTSYGGFELEYVNRPSRLFHFSFQVLGGSGDVEYETDEVPLSKTSDRYFVLQPGANIVMNVTSWFRLSGGIFYRWADGVQLTGTNDTELSGVATFVTLRFGWF